MKSTLDYNASVLMERGKNTRAACACGKLIGLLAIPAGVIACLTGNFKVGLPAATVGSVVYGAAVGKELNTVGRVMPLPFCDWDIGMIARSASVRGEKAPALTGLDFLSLPERSRFALSTTLKPLTLQLMRLDYTEQAVAYQLLCNGMVRLYPHLLNDVSVLPSYVSQLNGGINGINASLTEALEPHHRKAFYVESSPLPDVLTPAQDAALLQGEEEDDEWEVEEFPGQWDTVPVEEPPKVIPEVAPEVAKRSVPEWAKRAIAKMPVAKTAAPKVEKTPVAKTPPKRSTRGVAETNAIKEIASSPFKPRIFLGNQRTGKTCTAALASKQAHEKFKTRIFRVNLVSVGDEDEKYWGHVADCDKVHVDTTSISFTQAGVYINQVIDLIDEFETCRNAIFIIDEISILASHHNQFVALLTPIFQRLAHHISTFSAVGLKKSQSVWYIGREFIAGTLIDSALAAKSMGLVVTSIAPDHVDYWTDPLTGEEYQLSYDGGLYTSTKRNFPSLIPPPERNKTSRITFVNNKWVSPGITGDEFG